MLVRFINSSGKQEDQPGVANEIRSLDVSRIIYIDGV
jgi:hypothetical protein